MLLWVCVSCSSLTKDSEFSGAQGLCELARQWYAENRLGTEIIPWKWKGNPNSLPQTLFNSMRTFNCPGKERSQTHVPSEFISAVVWISSSFSAHVSLTLIPTSWRFSSWLQQHLLWCSLNDNSGWAYLAWALPYIKYIRKSKWLIAPLRASHSDEK